MRSFCSMLSTTLLCFTAIGVSIATRNEKEMLELTLKLISESVDDALTYTMHARAADQPRRSI
jgi:hypothetical protein